MMITCSCRDAKRQPISESGTIWPGVTCGIKIICKGFDDFSEVSAIFTSYLDERFGLIV